jgi:hypothetical protein
MIDELLNAEYEQNPPIHSGASEAHMHMYIRTYILKRVLVTIDGVRSGNWIY